MRFYEPRNAAVHRRRDGEADEIRVPIAVVNAAGHLVTLQRVDETRFITAEITWVKAYTAVAFRAMPRGLVIQQWLTKRNPQMTAKSGIFTNGRIVTSGGSPSNMSLGD